jgi:hypothetical protein
VWHKEAPRNNFVQDGTPSLLGSHRSDALCGPTGW